jgi:hypothetical protein
MAEVGLNIFIRVYDQAKGTFTRLEDDLGAAQKRADGLNRSMEHSQAVLRSAGQAATVTGLAILAAAGYMVNSASNAEESGSKFDAVFKSNSASARQWVTEQADALNRSRFALEGYMSTLQDTFVPMGVARGEAAELSKQVTTLAIDLASFNNTTEQGAVEDLQSALVGNHETMRKYGVVISETTLGQELLSMGIRGGTQEATEQQKVMARLNIIMRGTTDAQGDAARTSGSFENQMKSLKGGLDEVAVAGGQALIPTLQLLIPVIRETAEWAADLAETPAGRGLVIAAAGAGLLGTTLGPILVMLPTIVEQLSRLQVAMTRIRAAAAVTATASRAMWAAITGPAGLAVLAVAAVTAALIGMGAAERRAKREAEEAAKARIDAENYDTAGLTKRIADLEKEIEVRRRVVESLREQYAESSNMARGLTFGLADPQADERRAFEESVKALKDLEAEITVARASLAVMGETERAQADAARDAAAATGQQVDAMAVAGDEIDGLTKAKKTLADAEKDGEKAARDAADAIEDATKRVSDAQEDAAERQEDAQKRIREAYESTLEAAEALQDAQKSAAERVADAEERAADRVERAKKSLADAQKAESKVGVELTPEERLAEQRTEAAERVREAEQELVDAQKSAEKDLVKAREEAAEEIESAQKRVQDAVEATREAQLDAEKARIEGLERVAEAEKALAKVQEDSAERVAQAAERVAETSDKVREATEKLNTALAKFPGAKYEPGAENGRRGSAGHANAAARMVADWEASQSGRAVVAARTMTGSTGTVTRPDTVAASVMPAIAGGSQSGGGRRDELIVRLDPMLLAEQIKSNVPDGMLSPEGRQALRILYRDLRGRETR